MAAQRNWSVPVAVMLSFESLVFTPMIKTIAWNSARVSRIEVFRTAIFRNTSITTALSDALEDFAIEKILSSLKILGLIIKMRTSKNALSLKRSKKSIRTPRVRCRVMKIALRMLVRSDTMDAATPSVEGKVKLAIKQESPREEPRKECHRETRTGSRYADRA